MSRDEKNRLGYTVGLISEFAAHYGLRQRQAYAYLKRFDSLKHLEENYGVLHTQSFQDGIEALSEVCSHHGGELK